jgi:hypothetical protein
MEFGDEVWPALIGRFDDATGIRRSWANQPANEIIL